VTLPQVKVEAKKTPEASKKAAPSTPTKAPPVKAAAPSPKQVPPQPVVKAETATSPVVNYVATQTATGTKTDTPLREIPQSISVVGQEQIRDQGAKTLQDTLRYVPGVVADGYGLDSRTDSVFVRGTEAAEYLDGLRRTFSYYVYNYRIDPYFMERVEVLRGPPSVLFGQAPVGGIVNSVTKRPQAEASHEITVEYGNFDTKVVKADITGTVTPDGRWMYRVVGMLRDADTQVDYTPDDRAALAPSLTFKPNAGTSITLLGHFQRDRTASTQQFLPHIGSIFPSKSGYYKSSLFLGEPGFDKYDTDVASGTLVVEHKFTDWLKLQHATRYADIHNEYNGYYPSFFYGPTGQSDFPFNDPKQQTITRVKYMSEADTQMWNSDTNLEAKFRTGELKHRVLGGVDFADFQSRGRSGVAIDQTPFNLYNPVYGQPERLGIPNYDPVTGAFIGFTDVARVPMFDDPRQQVTQTGIYVQDQMRLGRWIGVVGARHDTIENWSEGSATQEDKAATYRAGLMYEFAGGFTPYVSYAQSFVPVVGLDRTGKAFDPQRGEMKEIGFKYQPPNTSFVINAALFDLEENNRLASDPVNPFFSVQTGSVGIQGFEIEVVGKLTRDLKIMGGYSYTDAVYTGGDQKGFRVESVPHHLASLWAVYSFNEGSHLKGWSIGGGVRYIGSSLDGYDQLTTPAVTLFDGMLSYETKDWRWSLNSYNLEDKFYMSTCLARGDCFVGARRTVVSTLTYKF